jgi:phage terminase large subunit-like protein
MVRAGQPLDDWQSDAIELLVAFRDDGKFACFEYGEIVSRQAGKGGILEARALTGLFLLGEPLIMWSAHEYKTALEAFRRVRAHIRHLGTPITPNLIDVDGVPVKVNNTNGEESFERLDTDQRIKFLARSKGSGRGFTGDCNIIDEAFAYTRDQQEALMPTVIARPNPQLIYTSTPPLDGLSGEPLYALRERAAAGGDEALGWRDWGLPGELEFLDDVDVDDRRNWRTTNPAVGGRITEQTIRQLRLSMSTEGFAREVLCIWPRRVKRGSGVIPADLWQSLADPKADRPADVTFALVVSRDRTRSAIGWAGRRGDGLLQVGLSDWRPGTAWAVDRLLELKAKWNPVGFVVSSKSESLLLDLEKVGIVGPEDADDPQRGDLAVPSAAQDAAAYGLFVDAARAEVPTLRHLDDAPVNSALAEASTRPAAGGATWDDRKTETAPLRAVTLALWLFEAWAHLVQADYDPLANIY